MKQRWLSEIEAIQRDARALLDGLSAEDANRQPEKGRWSVAQNLDHITKTALPYLDVMAEQLANGAGPREFRPGILAGFLTRTMEPPPRMRVKTLRRLEPEATLDTDAVLAAFDATHERLATMLRDADDGAFLRSRLRSPFMSLIRFRLDQAVDTLLAHARRHIWQARQARRAIGVAG